jgi:hypothetical protein
MRSDLVLAYRATDYVAFSDGRAFFVRIGHHSLVIDGLLTRMKARSGTFITAASELRGMIAWTNTAASEELLLVIFGRAAISAPFGRLFCGGAFNRAAPKRYAMNAA